MNEEKKPVFIIAHKYFRGYVSYLKHYVENILEFYGENSLIIIVDNNSNYPQDVWDTLPKRDNIHFLINNIESKFELGAYQVGMDWVIQNNLLDHYDYYVCTQDTFIIKNKVDFTSLFNQNIWACPINSYHQDGYEKGVYMVLDRLGLNNNLDKVTFCWCNSFIVHATKLVQFHGYLENIILKTKEDSHDCERYLARLLWESNDYKNNDIDGDQSTLPSRHYFCWTVDPLAPATSYFVKKIQQKNENTQDT